MGAESDPKFLAAMANVKSSPYYTGGAPLATQQAQQVAYASNPAYYNNTAAPAQPIINNPAALDAIKNAKPGVDLAPILKNLGLSPLAIKSVLNDPTRKAAGTDAPANGDPKDSPLIDEKELGNRTDVNKDGKVDNADGMPRTSPELLAMLNQGQIDQAALPKVLTMFECTGCNEAQKLELGFYLQRFIVDGMIRGEDVIKNIQDQGGLKFNMDYTPGRGIGGMADTGGGVNVSLYGWGDYSDGWKFDDFYHEVGHNLLERGHNYDPNSVMYGPGDVGQLKGPEWLSGVYDYAMGELYNPDNWAKTQAPPGVAPKVDPNAYPQTTPGTPLPPAGPVDPNPVGQGAPQTAAPPVAAPAPNVAPIGPTSLIGPAGPTVGVTGSPYYQGPPTRMASSNQAQQAVAQQFVEFGENAPRGSESLESAIAEMEGGSFSPPGSAGSSRAPRGAGANIPNPFRDELGRMLQQGAPMLRGLGGALTKWRK